MSDTDYEFDDSLEQLQRGGETALAEFFRQHDQRLRQIIFFRVDPRMAGRVDQEDVIQETFCHAAKRLPLFLENPEVSPFIWLRSMLNQTMIELYRRHVGAQKRDAGREISIDQFSPQATSMSLAFQLVGNLTSPSKAVARDEMVGRIRELIDAMEPIDREVLVLRHYEELTNNEIAEVLQIKKGTASIRYVRALERLKKIVDEFPGMAEFSPASTH